MSRATEPPNRPRPRRVTLRDIATSVGVDPSAVSRVVNNDPRVSVSEATRERILAAVQELGYRPNFGARSLRVSKAWTIGFVLPTIYNPMYEPLVRGVQRAADAHGYGIVLGSQVDGHPAETFAELLQEGRVDGLLIASGTLKDEFIRAIAETGPGPVIPVNRRVEGVASSVVVDDEGASRTAARYLQSLGHTFVAGIFGPPEIDTSVRRKTGFCDGIVSSGARYLALDSPNWTAEDGYNGARRVITEHPGVTAIYASTFLMGIGALRAAAELGRSVPRSLSVLTLHDSDLANFLVPTLSTVRLPTEEAGAAAVELLIERAAGGPDRAVMIQGAGEVVVRSSTGPPP